MGSAAGGWGNRCRVVLGAWCATTARFFGSIALLPITVRSSAVGSSTSTGVPLARIDRTSRSSTHDASARLPMFGDGRNAVHGADIVEMTMTRSSPRPATTSALLGEGAPPATYVSL